MNNRGKHPFSLGNNNDYHSNDKADSIRLMEDLSDENKWKALELAKKLDPSNSRSLIFFGSEAQQKLLSFSHAMIEQVQKKDVGEVGEIISDLMKRLDEINPDDLKLVEKPWYVRIFKRVTSSVSEILSRYQKANAQMDRITVRLERSKNLLVSDMHLLEQLYENNKAYFHLLNTYIAAGELKLEELHKKTIPQLKEVAEQSKDEMKKQEVNDWMEFADRLDQRVYDLKISRQITIQTAPQIRMIQQTNQTVVEKIQTSIMTAIPLWRNQVSIALTLLRQRYAMETEKQMRNSTDALFVKNAKSMQSLPTDINDLSEIDALKETQSQLIQTLVETLQIQENGSKNRMQTEKEWFAMENGLKAAIHSFKENM